MFLQKDTLKSRSLTLLVFKKLIDESNDPDINFFNDKSWIVDSPYFSINKLKSLFQKLLRNLFPILHVNIRSLNKSFEKLCEYLYLVKRYFSAVALKETLCNDDKAAQN